MLLYLYLPLCLWGHIQVTDLIAQKENIIVLKSSLIYVLLLSKSLPFCGF